MSDDTNVSFHECVDGERTRLESRRAEMTSQMRDFQDEIAAIDRELAAIGAYEAAKTGKQQPARNGAAPRARRGSRREAILSAVGSAPTGLSRGELLDAFGLKGDKSGEMSVSNALTALTKANVLVRDGGKYLAVAGLQEAAE